MANARKEVHQNATLIKDIIPNSGGLGQSTRNEEVEDEKMRIDLFLYRSWATCVCLLQCWVSYSKKVINYLFNSVIRSLC